MGEGSARRRKRTGESGAAAGLGDPEIPRSKPTPAGSAEDWTSGFYPGVVWHLYGYSKDAFWKENAEKVTAFLEEQQYNTKAKES